uniref:Uncharacterized protein n=1 Tax=viral metagenome TaxID=1070528 RepID=A0A6C0JVZ6_9ZZZZ
MENLDSTKEVFGGLVNEKYTYAQVVIVVSDYCSLLPENIRVDVLDYACTRLCNEGKVHLVRTETQPAIDLKKVFDLLKN